MKLFMQMSITLCLLFILIFSFSAYAAEEERRVPASSLQKEASEEIFAQEKMISLVLDLDDVFLHDPTENENKYEKFTKRSFLLKDKYGYHYIIPAFLTEFLQFLRAHKFNIHFFSSGDNERNRSVVTELWKQVFNEELPEGIKILSRSDLTQTVSDDKLQPENYLRFHGNKKKDLRKIGALTSTVLIDDDCSWVMRGQVANLLKVPSGSFSDFFDLTSRIVETTPLVEMKSIIMRRKNNFLPYYKLLYVTGIIKSALYAAEGFENDEDSFINALYSIQFESEKKFLYYDLEDDLNFYIKGYLELSKIAAQTKNQYSPLVEKILFTSLEATNSEDMDEIAKFAALEVSSDTATSSAADSSEVMSAIAPITSTDSDSEVEGELIEDIECLKPYYEAIALIRLELKKAMSTLSYKIRTRLKSINPFYYRTPEFIFLETSALNDQTKEVLQILYTPFGQVEIFDSALGSRLLSVSSEFFRNIDWEIVDITRKVKAYEYDQVSNIKYGPVKVRYETSGLSYSTYKKIYLLKRIGDIRFDYEPEKELAYFLSVRLAEGQYAQDTHKFEVLSKGS